MKRGVATDRAGGELGVTIGPSRIRAAAGLLGGLFAGILTGCTTVGPNYTPPEKTVSAAWSSLSEAGETQSSGQAAELKSWWAKFNDPVLNGLVDRALVKNPTLRSAAARVLEARALRGIADSEGLPTVDARGGAFRQQQSRNGQPPLPKGQDDPSWLFSAGVDAGWELDLFGRARRVVEAADADLMAAEWSRRDVLVSLVAEVCSSYAEYRGAQRRLEVINGSVQVQSDTLDVATARAKAGIASDLEVVQAAALLATRRAQAPQIEITRRVSLFRISVLLGEEPAALANELAAVAPLPVPPARIETGIPSDLLRRRPDVRRAERNLAAATARIGVATADLYPRVSLTGTFGLESTELKAWPDWASRSWSIGPSVRWNIFDADRIRNSIRAADARTQGALADWDATVLGAFEEVERRLVGLAQEQARRGYLADAVGANRRAVALSRDLYKAGVRDFLNVLDSQRELYDTEDQLVVSEILVATNTIALYKSLGGGWEVPEPVEPVPGEGAAAGVAGAPAKQ